MSFEADIDGKKVKADVTFYTAYIYEAEFQSDLIKDFIGKQDDDPIVELDEDGQQVVRIDFTKVDWNSMTKVLWAAVKTARESTPPYAQWVKKAKGVNLLLVQEQLGQEVGDCFFRAEAAGEEAQEG